MPFSSLLTVSAKAICVRGRILVYQTLTTPQAGISQEDCSRLTRFPSAFSRGLGNPLASLSIPQVTWTAALLLAPPFHMLTTHPFPAPSRAGTRLQRYPGRWVPWALAPEDPHPIHRNKSVHSRWLAAKLPQLLYCQSGLPRHHSLLRHILHVSLSENGGSTEKQKTKKHSSRAGSGFFAQTVQAWRTMEQLSGFLYRRSFVPPFPPAWLSLAEGQRLLGSLLAKAQTFP